LNIFKKYIKLWFSIVLAIVIFVIIVNYITDPYQRYRLNSYYPLEYKADISRKLIPGLAKNCHYDTIITGSSMVENFLLSDVKKLGVNPIKFSMSGSTAFEINLVLKRVFSQKQNVRMVIISVDIPSFIGPIDRIKNGRSSFPFYLFNNNDFIDHKYLVSGDNFIESLKCLSRLISYDTSPYVNDLEYMFQWQHLHNDSFTINNVQQSWLNVSSQPLCKDSWKLDNLINSYNSNILKHITQNHDTKFLLFFPPYSIYAYKLWYNNNLLGLVNKFKEHIHLSTKTLENCELFDFQLSHGIICNLDNYKDYSHYHQNINSLLIQHIINNRFNVKKLDYTNDLFKLYKLVERYN
tara:strand:- start:198 stop:1250 length:1053 start_codon:yes stop_codon:yes gene_type:complete